MSKLVYIRVCFNLENYSEELLGSLKVLPGVQSVETFYPDDPALFNIILLTTFQEDSEDILRQTSQYEFVEFVEIIKKPEVR